MIKLIINADDFGYGKLFNKMILELIEEGAATSTSVMVDEIDSKQKEQIKKLIQLSKGDLVSVGLHIYFKNTHFKEEVKRQFKKFIDIFGFEPSHIDIHKMDYLKKGYPVIQKFCKQKKIPCKNLSLFDNKIMNTKGLITTQDSIYDGTKKSFYEIKEWLNSLQEGFFCINFHPGYYDSKSISAFNKQREIDAKNIRKIISGLNKFNIELANFNDLKKNEFKIIISKLKDFRDFKNIINIQQNDGFNHSYYLTKERLKQLTKRGESFFIAFLDNQPVAFASIDFEIRAKLHFFSVKKERVKQGIGTELLSKVLHEAIKKGYEKVHIFVESNSPLEHFLIKNNFKKVGIYYDRYGPKKNSHILEKSFRDNKREI